MIEVRPKQHLLYILLFAQKDIVSAQLVSSCDHKMRCWLVNMVLNLLFISWVMWYEFNAQSMRFISSINSLQGYKISPTKGHPTKEPTRGSWDQTLVNPQGNILLALYH